MARSSLTASAAVLKTEFKSSEFKPPEATAVEALLHELVAEVRGLRQDLRARTPSSLSRSDRLALSRILPAIGGVIGSELFAVRELFASEAPALRVVLPGLTAK